MKTAAPEAVQATPVAPDNGKAVYRCILAVSADLAKIGVSKSRRNEQQNYRFRGIDEVMNALSPLLVAHGLIIIPRILTRSSTEHQSKGGGTLFYVVVEAEFDFVAVSDASTHTARMFGEAMDSADKATNKAMSAAYKYAAFQTFCIPTEGDGDTDADIQTHEVRPKPPVPETINQQTGEVKTEPARTNHTGDKRPITTVNKDGKGRGQLGRLIVICARSGRSNEEIKAWLKAVYGWSSRSQITQEAYEAVCTAIEKPGPLPMPTTEREPGSDDE